MISTLHLNISQPTDDTFAATITATGNTHEHKDALKQQGFRFVPAIPASSSFWELNAEGERVTIRDLVTRICNAVPAEQVTR